MRNIGFFPLREDRTPPRWAWLWRRGPCTLLRGEAKVLSVLALAPGWADELKGLKEGFVWHGSWRFNGLLICLLIAYWIQGAFIAAGLVCVGGGGCMCVCLNDSQMSPKLFAVTGYLSSPASWLVELVRLSKTARTSVSFHLVKMRTDFLGLRSTSSWNALGRARCKNGEFQSSFSTDLHFCYNPVP